MKSRADAYLRAIHLRRDTIEDADVYPFSIPALRAFRDLELHPKVTFFVGENGSGKSTLLEAVAVAAGFNAEGGSRNFRFTTRSSESSLHRHLKLVRGVRRPRTGYFLRAESYFNVATEIERMDAEPGFSPPVIDGYGGRSLHECSHGESFMALVRHRFGPGGLYLLDEPEAALSPQRQLSLLSAIGELAERQASQFVIATHSPILLAYPRARIFEFSAGGLRPVRYEETEQFTVTRDFLLDHRRYLQRLLGEEDA